MLSKGWVAIKRIKEFLLLEETNENDIQHENTGDIVIQMKNVNVGWDRNEPFLCKYDPALILFSHKLGRFVYFSQISQDILKIEFKKLFSVFI